MRRIGSWQWVALAGAAVAVVGVGVARVGTERRAMQASHPRPASPMLGRQGAMSVDSPGIEREFPARAVADGTPAREAAWKVAGRSPGDPLAAVEAGRVDRYLIRNATLTLEARDAREAAAKLTAVVTAARGYVSETSESVDGLGSRSITLQARVPADRFDRVMGEVEGLGRVAAKQIAAEDVTEEFVDAQARVRNLKHAESRLLEHLNRTGRVADVLLVEKELNRVRGEIERIEGRLRFLAHRVAFSTFAITISEAPRPQAIVPPESFSSGKEASAAVRSLVAFAQVLWTGAIWAAVWAAVWGPLALAAWLLARRARGPARQEGDGPQPVAAG